MTLRTNYFEIAPDAINILMAQETYLAEQFTNSTTINKTTWELVKLRVSQINQCAFCIDMHSHELLNSGESSPRLIGLNAWRDLPLYSEFEQTALSWAEQITLGAAISETEYQNTLHILGEKALVNLTIAINAINSWNRIAKTFKPEVGRYRSQ